jgi:PAS domain S-box-containing protein
MNLSRQTIRLIWGLVGLGLLVTLSTAAVVAVALVHVIAEERALADAAQAGVGPTSLHPGLWAVMGVGLTAAAVLVPLGLRLPRMIRRQMDEVEALNDALRLSEKRYRALVDHLDGIVYRCRLDADWTMLYMSPQARAITGYPVEEFLENQVRSFASIIHEEDRVHVERVVTEATRAGNPYEIDYRIMTADGAVRWMYERGQLVSFGEGPITMMQLEGFIIDITERQAQRQKDAHLTALRTISEEVARALLDIDELAEAGWLILNKLTPLLRASRAYVFRYENNQVARQTHCCRGPGFGGVRSWPLRVNMELLPALMERVNRETIVRIDDLKLAPPSWLTEGERSLMAQEGVRGMLLLPVRIDGRCDGFFGFETMDRALPWDGNEVQSIRVMIDNFGRAVERRTIDRERTRTSAMLQEAVDRAEAANRHKTQFLASMSHEIRTPMTAIVGYADMLTRGKLEEAEQTELSQLIRTNADYLLTLVNDILDLSKIEAGRATLQRAPTRLRTLFEEVRALFAQRAQEKGLELRFEFATPLPVEVLTDAQRCKQIVVNLVSNALKFTQAGHITISARCDLGAHHAEQGCTDARLSIAVEDTGIGIAPDKLAQLFRPFSQVHKTQGNPLGGTGLGLAISRQFAHMLEGDIHVASNPGQGSLFTVEFALQLPDETAWSNPAELTAALGAARSPSAGNIVEETTELRGRRILVVDDSIDNRRIAGFLLQQRGAAVTPSEDGRAGVETALKARDLGQPFDIILMDMMMPVMDGYEAAATLRQCGVREPIIALTALAMTDDMSRCLKAGCSGYVTKPIEPLQLYRVLREQLDTKYASSVPLETPQDLPTEVNEETHGQANPPAPPPVAPAPAAPAPTSAGYDLSALPGYADLVAEYVVSLGQTAQKMRDALDSDDVAVLRTLTHRLKGSGASFGFPELTAAARPLESHLREGKPLTEVRNQLDELLRMIDSARARSQAAAA